MRSAEVLGLLSVLVAAGCGGGGGGSSGVSSGADANVVPLSVDGKLCTNTAGYPNKPCVQVTVCAPGTSQCQTIDDVLLDTGSFGLRLFRQALGSVTLQQVRAGGAALATCVQFADNSSDWGPVQLADVVLGGEPAVRVPVHVLDSGFSTPPSSCPNPEASPAAAGFNGILGVGIFTQDCGPGCADASANGIYFACDATTCAGSRAPLSDQVTNPVALLPEDNNGVVVDLPAVAADGAPSAEGSLLLGVGTRANNGLASATAFPVDPASGTFTTTLEGTVMDGSFLDTGSNGLFFEPPSASVLAPCPAAGSRWFCPASTVSYTATNTGFHGAPSAQVPFQVGNFEAMATSGNRVFPALGGKSFSGAGFDWGLPFHLGRRVAVGFEGRSSSLGAGPLVAY